MPTFSSASPTFAGGDYMSWTSPLSPLTIYSITDNLHVIRFSGAADVLAGSGIASATLTLTNVPTMFSAQMLIVRGDETADAALPATYADASARPRTVAFSEQAITSETDCVFDIDLVLTELQATIDGDVISLFLVNDSITGAINGLGATISVTFTTGTTEPLDSAATRARSARPLQDIPIVPVRNRQAMSPVTEMGQPPQRTRSTATLVSRIDHTATRERESLELRNVPQSAVRRRVANPLNEQPATAMRLRRPIQPACRLDAGPNRSKAALALRPILGSIGRSRSAKSPIPRVPRHIQFATINLKPAGKMTAVEILRAGKVM